MWQCTIHDLLVTRSYKEDNLCMDGGILTLLIAKIPTKSMIMGIWMEFPLSYQPSE